MQGLSRIRFGFARLIVGLAFAGFAAFVLAACDAGDDGSNGSNGSSGLPDGEATREQVLRGRYLVTSSGCSDCHNRGVDDPNDPQWLAGFVDPTAGQPFQIGPFNTFAANLTPDVDTGLGSWSAEDIFNAIRNGKNIEDKFLAPPMPWPALRNYNDDDIWSIVAYLRSVKPVRNPVPAPEGPIVDGEVDWSSAYANLQPLPSYPAENEIEVTSNDGPGLPDGEATRDQVLQGRYFVTSSGCIDCHNRGVDDPNDPLWLAGFTEGTAGQPFMIGPFKTYAANLTPDEETGLGSWSAEDIFNALRNGKNIEDSFLAPPMPWPVTRNLTDDDLWSIVAYLRSIEPVNNAVPASEGPIVNGGVDWSSAYADLQPLPPYPAGNEIEVE